MFKQANFYDFEESKRKFDSNEFTKNVKSDIISASMLVTTLVSPLKQFSPKYKKKS